LIYNAGIAAKYAAVHHEVIPVPFTYQELTFWAQWALTVGGLAFSAALALLASVGAIRVFQKKAPSESNVES
jgi:hypothetical protein